MAKQHSKSPSSNKTGLSCVTKAKRACVAAAKLPPSSSLLATSSCSWAVKRARGARRRRRLPTRCWADLTYGPAGVIAEHALANDVSDYTSFRAVCRGWRRDTQDTHRPRGVMDRRFHPRQWIMLREAKPPGPDRHRRRFLNVDTGECVQKELPELDGHRLLGATTEGLLVLLHRSTYVVRVLNPVTRQVAELPSLDPLLSTETRETISKYGLAYALKVTGVGLAGDSTIVLCFYYPTSMLVVARPGDASWTVVETKGWFYTAMSFQGRFYCIAVEGNAVMALDMDVATANQPPRLVVAAKLTFWVSYMCRDTVHLVESDGRLLLLRRKLSFTFREEFHGYIRTYKVFALDLAAKKTVLVRGLGGRAVFFGKTRALSVSPLVFPSIRANKVYPATDISERVKNGVGSCSLLNGKIERCMVRMSTGTDGQDRKFCGGWERPCGIGDYLSWYVSGKCNWIQEI